MLRTLPLLALALAAPAPAADLTIDDIAPPETILVARVSDWSAMRAALEETPLWAASERDSVRAWLTGLWEGEAFESLREELAALEIEADEIPLPSGRVGLAIWNAGDEEGFFIPAYCFVADFGERAEDAYDLLIENAELEEERGTVRVEFDDEGDYEVLSMLSTFDVEAHRAELLEDLRRNREEYGDGFDDEFWNGIEQNIREDDFDEMLTEVHALRADELVFIATERETISDAIAALEGDEIPSLAATGELAALRASVRGAHADVVVVPSAVESFLDTVNENVGYFLPPMLIDSLGLDQIQGAVAGLRFDAPDAQIELSLDIPMKRRAGLFSLVKNIDAFAPPAFIPAEAVNVTSFAIDWGGVIPFARDVILKMPEDQRAMMEGQFAAFSIAAGPIFQSLGSELILYSTLERPLAATSAKALYAVRVANEAVISGAIAQYGKMMGLEAREFLGSQIFEAPAMMGAPFGVGLGSGWAFVGPPEEIENAFRRLSAENPASLAQTDAFRDAATHTTGGAASYAYSDLVAHMEFEQWVSNNIETYVRAAVMNEWMDEEYFEWIVEDLNSNPTYAALRDAPEMKSFQDAVGPLVQEFHISDTGLTGRMLLLEPAE